MSSDARVSLPSSMFSMRRGTLRHNSCLLRSVDAVQGETRRLFGVGVKRNICIQLRRHLSAADRGPDISVAMEAYDTPLICLTTARRLSSFHLYNFSFLKRIWLSKRQLALPWTGTICFTPSVLMTELWALLLGPMLTQQISVYYDRAASA